MTLYRLTDGTGQEVARTPSYVLATMWSEDTGTAIAPIRIEDTDTDTRR